MIDEDIEIKSVIEKYLQARALILELSKRYPHRIGGNDNIIGRIGEFIALRFLEGLGQRPQKVESSSHPFFDLIEGDKKTQVKVITNENKKQRTGPLKQGWDQFILIKLGSHYVPERIGLLTRDQHDAVIIPPNSKLSKTPIVKSTMLGPKGLIGKYGRVYEAHEIEI